MRPRGHTMLRPPEPPLHPETPRGSWYVVQPGETIEQIAGRTGVPVEDLLTLEGALTRLEAIDPRGAEIVTLRFYSGMSVPEVAEHQQVTDVYLPLR